MTWVDYSILTVIGVSVLLSLIHGLARELIALASWIVAFLIAQQFASQAVHWVPAAITNPSIRLLVAFAAIFLVVLIAMSLVGMLVSKLIRGTGLGIPDRILGALFGFMRGLVIVTIAVVLAGLTKLPREPEWRQAQLIPPFETLAKMAKPWLPYDLSRHINYS